MAGISINLIPATSRTDQKAQKKIKTVQTASIAVLLTLIFLSSLATALNIFESQRVNKINSEAKLREEKVLKFKDKEAQVSVLKNRLSLINKVNMSSKKDNSEIYRSILGYIPSSVNTPSISVDRGGIVITSLIIPDTQTLEQTLLNLTSDEAFEKITKIDIDSLSRSRDGSYRAILKIQN